MKSRLLGFGSLALLAISAFNANAGGDPVNCRTQTTYQTVYFGSASCYTQGTWLQEYIHSSIFSQVHLSEISNGKRLSCSATLNQQRQEPVTSEVCDYTPNASLSLYRFEGDTSASVTLRGSDQDGSITKYELWVDGVRKSSNTATLYGNQGDTFTVRGRVTDNDGYTTETSRTVTLIFRPPARCGKYLC
ncbi:hypothetical protein PSECIP111951_00922 [Pseudoalteromonas holothuriae]|uniref:Ig-like domain-containing protein n=1 Tax=Pseudoalteromonas holothuriae TaxID=2963714 RepID=A0A9W4VPN7_9GAMM|nr:MULTISPECIES: hypothetical protein [unclassified Pseudoalteromonas]CAH9053926.1 hypothetical protein PSECIP111951_00922 [Pseudoalteromonas sp. CIP111951]CAH9055692.1 hypothetical protein PSECIP111854_01629 [Pseudoalteromonas sp. CIP111854]